MNKLYVTYLTIKPLLNVIPTYYIELGDGSYTVLAIGDESAIVSHVKSTDITNFETNYKASARTAASEDDALVAGSIRNGVPFVKPRLPDGRIRTVSEKTSISTVTFYSHNWADKTTWYEKSTRVANETASNSGDNLTYTLAHKFIIDSYHGKYTNEDYIVDSSNYSYRVAVTVDGYTKTEQDPHLGTGGDFIINYEDGYVIFLSALNPVSVVSATYHYAGTSVFSIKPTAGKQLRFGVVEVQFSDDIQITDSILFQPYGYVDVFAPQYCTTNGGPYPPGTKIPLGSPLVYKTMQDYLNDSKKSYPIYPALGGNGWRGMQNPCIIMDWDYEGDKVLRYDYGMEIRVFLQHDLPFGGSYGTATFYCKSEPL